MTSNLCREGTDASTRSASASWRALARRVPVVAYLFVYLVTCYIGALALLVSPRFRIAYVVFSGAQVPDLSAADVVTTLILLHAGPLLLLAGYELGLRLPLRVPTFRSEPVVPRAWWPRAVAVTTFAAGCWSLWRVDAWHGLSTWLNYNNYIHARLRLFDSLFFVEFVTLYTLVPLSASYLFLTERRRPLAWAALAAVPLLQYPLAQRKVLLTSALLIAAAVFLHRYAGSLANGPRRAAHRLRWMGAFLLLLYSSYVVLTLLTVLGPRSSPFSDAGSLLPPERRARTRAHLPDALVSFRIDDAEVQRIQKNRAWSVFLYVTLSPLTRTSIAAIAYPAVFPRLHSYYHVDMGQDILGYGRMPEDNLVVYNVLWPDHGRGALGAPFQVVFYAQGGLGFACVGSVAVGLFLAWAWRCFSAAPGNSAAVALCGAIVLVFSIFIAIDSVRNSLLVSYGLFWAFVAVLLMAGVAAWSTRHEAAAVA